MRVAVADLGSNSTRLLIADIGGGAPVALERESIVTRLGEGVDATGELGREPRRRVLDVLGRYRGLIERHGCDRTSAVMTSAVRDARNGEDFARQVAGLGLEARVLSGDQEAELTFAGATASRDDREEVLVCDVGGGSTELVLGRDGRAGFHVSTQVGVVRHSERHLAHDPPGRAALAALRSDVRREIEAAVPAALRGRPGAAIAVAGTPTMCAAMELGLDAYDPDRVEGHVLRREVLDAQLDHLASLPLERRRAVRGLHPDRAATIVAGVAVLLEIAHVFSLGAYLVSDRDLLWGEALRIASDS